METVDRTSQDFQKLEKILEKIKIGMLTTISQETELHSRPMYSQKFDSENATLWFFSANNSGKVVDIEKNHHVHVSFADPSDSSFLSICGQGEIVDDMAKKKELWSDALLAWFPDGLKDPNLTLISIKIHTAEYWDSASKLVKLFGYTKAILTGEKYNVDRSEHGKVAPN